MISLNKKKRSKFYISIPEERNCCRKNQAENLHKKIQLVCAHLKNMGEVNTVGKVTLQHRIGGGTDPGR